MTNTPLSRYSQYSTYKYSDVEWLGMIPEHWKISKIKLGYNICLGKMLQPQPQSSKDTLEPYLRSANVVWEGIDINDIQFMWFSQMEKIKFELLIGDLIVCEGGDVGRASLWESQISPCFIQNAVHRVRPKEKFSNKYLYYWLYSLKMKGYIDLICSKATISHLTGVKLANLPLVIPLFPEQRAIADFLDRETARIDSMIAKYKRLIELLEEKRTSLISQAVTKGLDSSVAMKESGVEWLGGIPEHWEITRLKKIAHVKFSSVDKHSFEDEESVFLCNYVDVYKNESITPEIEFMKATASKEEIKKYTLKKNDVLITKDSESWNDIAVSAHVPDDLDNVLCGYHLALIRPNPKQIDGRFLFYSFQSRPINYQFEVEATGITRYGIDQYAISSGIILIPLLSEQRAIADFLDRETAQMDGAKEKIQSMITKLQEYRTTLISAAVTGKIDVTNHEV